eukprot:CAMPEP_0201567326 /NCGR_PEP_ID=MMETSP0190_2-20130828/7786_1 /ASSEMBLY_ACC=CAM_ASM_000263 /TAXON_ID=37353 /ORGANISM="Rosalina sp." /LENGTH=181 /DNA_ID=CAMNT_0047987183 /DNA_START=94 /DNA_END=642 /DNA_ORIENTATION=+
MAASYGNKSQKAQPKPSGGLGVKRKSIELSKEEKGYLQAAFNWIDEDGNGTVEPEEIAIVMKKLNIELTKEEVTDIMCSLDENGDGVMDFGEFVDMMNRRLSLNSQRKELRDTFNVFDKNGDGKISFEELKEVLIGLGEEVTDKDVRDMIKEADLNGDGFIDFEEFMIMMGANGGNAQIKR